MAYCHIKNWVAQLRRAVMARRDCRRHILCWYCRRPVRGAHWWGGDPFEAGQWDSRGANGLRGALMGRRPMFENGFHASPILVPTIKLLSHTTPNRFLTQGSKIFILQSYFALSHWILHSWVVLSTQHTFDFGLRILIKFFIYFHLSRKTSNHIGFYKITLLMLFVQHIFI